MRKTIRKQGKRRRTHRLRTRRGGADSELEAILSRSLMKPDFVNPSSRFVVVTYWWGKGRLNRNTQRPCPEDITEPLKEEMEETLVKKDNIYTDIYERFISARDIWREAGMPKTGKLSDTYRSIGKEREIYLADYFAKPETVLEIKDAMPEYEKKLAEAGKFKAPILFEDMIEKWKAACKAANCSYMAVEVPEFAKPGGYQLAINAKPLFIRKALNVLEGRAALYIDGDMLIRRYPAIFDMPNVDFMARGWNVDPRGSPAEYRLKPCFDPYIFETSGGTMFFANTPSAITLLNKWQAVSDQPNNIGKADDRILSMIISETSSYVERINMIQLPIEYLWLSDKFDGKLDEKDTTVPDIYIDHLECLTGEERAGELSSGTVSSSRTPDRYAEVTEQMTRCDRAGGDFYERIFFPKKGMVCSFAPYLGYIKATAARKKTEQPMFNVIAYDNDYGDAYNPIVSKNIKAAKDLTASTLGKFEIGKVTIPEILAHLMKGVDVKIGDIGEIDPDAECIASRLPPEGGDKDDRSIRVDSTKAIFFSAKSRVLIQLLSMCNTLKDMNVILKESYIFISRIRWFMTGTIVPIPESDLNETESPERNSNKPDPTERNSNKSPRPKRNSNRSVSLQK